MIIAIFATIVLTSLVAIGMYKVTEEGQLLHFLHLLGKHIKPLNKPLSDCVTCMAGSVYNVITVLLLATIGILPFTLALIPILIINGLASAGLATWLYSMMFE